MTVDMDEETVAEVNEAIQELRAHRPDTTFEQELALAGAFVAHFGSLGSLFEEPELTAAQFSMSGQAAWSLLGHWSVERGDPTDEPKSGFEEHSTGANGCDVCQYLEKCLELRESFEYEFCEECGLDVQYHAIGPDPIGLPHAYCVSPWVRVDPLVHEAADAGGDDQISPVAYEARWQAKLTDGTFALITRYFYVIDRDGRVFVEEQTEYLVCTDPSDPGSTEINAEYTYNEVEHDGPINEHTDVKTLAFHAEAPGLDEWDEFAPEFARGLLAERE